MTVHNDFVNVKDKTFTTVRNIPRKYSAEIYVCTITIFTLIACRGIGNIQGSCSGVHFGST